MTLEGRLYSEPFLRGDAYLPHTLIRPNWQEQKKRVLLIHYSMLCVVRLTMTSERYKLRLAIERSEVKEDFNREILDIGLSKTSS
jgi:hypothetical protein